MARWAEAVFGDTLLTPASRAKLLTPVQANYALGVRVANFQGRKLIEHGGNISGFSSFLRHYPEPGVTIVVLSNLTTGNSIVEDLVGKLAAATFEDSEGKPSRAIVAVPPAILETYCGVYEVRPGTQVTFRLIDGKLTAQPTGQPAMEVFAESETRFYFKSVNTEVEFIRDPGGRVTHLMMKRDGRTRQAPRVSD